jgi:flagellar protein FliO/FliZ
MTPTPDFTWLFVKMIAGLILVLALAVILIRFVLPRTRIGRARRASWASLIDRFPLEAHRSLYVIKILERYFVLGSSEHSVHLITELSKAEGEKIETS